MRSPDRERYIRWIPWEPFDKQREFIEDETPNILYGGSVGSAKTSAVVMKMTAPVDTPGYHGLICRKTKKSLEKPGSPLLLAKEWFAGSEARFNREEMRFTFPSGATLEFSDLSDERSLAKLWGASFTKIAIDESQDIDPAVKRKLRTRNRKPDWLKVSLQWLETANPGGRYNDDLLQTYVHNESDRYKFIRARLWDNPHIDHDEYLRQMEGLTEAEREQLVEGNFEFVLSGEFARSDWFKYCEPADWPNFSRYVRAYDPCWLGSQKTDEMGSVLAARSGQKDYVADAAESHIHITELFDAIVRQASIDPPGTVVAIEKSSLSIAVLRQLKDTGLWVESELSEAGEKLPGVLADQRAGRERRMIVVVPQVGDKLDRASGHLTRLRAGGLVLRRGPWAELFVKRHVQFTNRAKDIDGLVDAMSNAERALDVIPTPVVPLEKFVIPGTHGAQREGRRNARRRR